MKLVNSYQFSVTMRSIITPRPSGYGHARLSPYAQSARLRASLQAIGGTTVQLN